MYISKIKQYILNIISIGGIRNAPMSWFWGF